MVCFPCCRIWPPLSLLVTFMKGGWLRTYSLKSMKDGATTVLTFNNDERCCTTVDYQTTISIVQVSKHRSFILFVTYFLCCIQHRRTMRANQAARNRASHPQLLAARQVVGGISAFLFNFSFYFSRIYLPGIVPSYNTDRHAS